eukprot:1324357-Amorphochlora_amoeboformis.AAC.1
MDRKKSLIVTLWYADPPQRARLSRPIHPTPPYLSFSSPMNTLVRRPAHLPPAKKTWGYVVVLAIACLIVYQFQPPPGPAMLSKSVQVSHEQTKISSKGWWGSRQSGPAKPEVVPKKKMQSAGFAIDS